MTSRATILLLLLTLASSSPAAAADKARCREAETEAYAEVPRLVYADRPDSVFGLLLDWDDACGPREVIQRTRILAAVWDDAFTEAAYDENILDDLARHREVMEGRPDPQSGDPRERYDAFTMSLADQLLPHTRRGSLESFFCLFYSGRAGEAWALLRSDDLADTELARWYANEREILAAPRKVLTIEATVGAWSPGGDMLFVGDKVVVGGMIGVRERGWLLRMPLEVRVGRTAYPYTARINGETRYSDRFDALMVGLEAGRSARLGDGLALDLFGGLGVDGVLPFKAEDLMLSAVHASVGAGLRAFVGPNRTWTLGLDGRREWVGARNDGGTPLGGSAWSLRFSIGIVPDQGRNAMQRALAP